jgi:hypothetical protein
VELRCAAGVALRALALNNMRAQAVSFRACGHSQCAGCLARLFASNTALLKTCPTCRTDLRKGLDARCVRRFAQTCLPLSSARALRLWRALPFCRSTPAGELAVPNFAARGVVEALRLHCRFGLRAADACVGGAASAWVVDAAGCPATLALAAVAAHEAACPYEVIACAHGPLHGFPRCGAQHRRADQAAHDAACTLRPAPCAHGCDALLPPSALLGALARGGNDAEGALAALFTHARAHSVCAHTALATCDALVLAMAANISHAGVQRAGCALLNHLRQHLVPLALGVSIIITVALAAMRAHPAEGAVLEGGCMLLGAVAARRGQLAVTAAGGLRAVLIAMRAQPSFAAVQEAACHALACITRAAANQLAACDAGGIEAVLCAMRAHTTEAGVQLGACLALSNITANAGNHAKANKLGVIPAVLATLRAHGDNADVQHAGCAALRNMTFDAPNTQVKAVNAGAVEAMLSAMRTHGTRLDVQLIACCALYNICDVRSDFWCRARGAGAVQVVNRALAQFPSCASFATAAANVLQAIADL